MAASTRIGALQPGVVFNERYKILSILGAGGMGMVLRVLDLNTERERALKVMLPTVVANAELRKRFAREATVSAKIDSEHIAEVVDAGLENESGVPFIVMELLKGVELEELIVKRGALPFDEVLLYLSQAAIALDKAHGRDIVHRDLKPENLYVTYRDDGTARIKLLDFGIAKVVSASMSGNETKGILGTPLYMAPEQAHAKFAISRRTDTYALAQIAYTALVGEAYFEQENVATDSVYQLIVALMDGPKEPASARASRRKGVVLPRAFDQWFVKGTASNGANRFDSAGELVAALAAAWGVAESQRPPMPSFHPPVEPVPVTVRPESGMHPVSSVPTAANQAWPGAAHDPTVASVRAPAAARTHPSGPLPGLLSTHGNERYTMPSGPSQGTHSPIVTTQAPGTARSGGMSGKTAAMVFGLVFVSLTAIGSAVVLRGETESPSADNDTVRRRSSDDKPAKTAKPTAEPVTASSQAIAPPMSPLAGAWQSTSSKLIYDAVAVDHRIEFRIRDPEGFGHHWQRGEWRFALIESGSDTYYVEDHIRPNPGPGYRYGEGPAPITCNFTYTELHGERLTAKLTDPNTVEVNMVGAAHEQHHFDLAGGVITGCKKLDTARTTPITSKLVRVRE